MTARPTSSRDDPGARWYLPDSPAWRLLVHTIRNLADIGQPAPCTDPTIRSLFTSEDPGDRMDAAQHCNGCPAYRNCQIAADEIGATAGVWAGISRTPNTERIAA